MVHLDRIKKGLDPSAPFPDATPERFFRTWLKHGTGGTCWAGHNALAALTDTLGFATKRSLATQLVSADARPNHGTVMITIDGRKFIVDASILSGAPIEISEGPVEANVAPWSCTLRMVDGIPVVGWRPLHLERDAWLDCRFDRGASQTEAGFRSRYENSKRWSPFNFSLNYRIIRSDFLVGFGMGVAKRRNATEERVEALESRNDRIAFLTDVLRVSEEVASALPDDQPIPPPPAD